MGRKLTRRSTAAALVGVVAVVSALLQPAQASTRTGTAPRSTIADAIRPDAPPPLPPRLPQDFQGKGVWVVRDLGITVPFTWEGRNGDSQMVAGGPQYPIWFSNLIFHGSLYTVTYKWPGLTDHSCSRLPGFDLDSLNKALAGSRFVGREVLQGSPDRYVNHWRVGVVLPQLPPGKFLRLPIALGDIYVDQQDRGTFWQVLQFGVQNLFDPELDEWLVMHSFDHRPGTVRLPLRCVLA